VLPELTALLKLQPAHAWARRERALLLSELGEHERATSEAEEAVAHAPQQASSQRVLSCVRLAAGLREAARAPAQRALELWADGSGGVTDLLTLAGSLSEQLELLRWSWQRVSERSLGGDGVLEWRAYAAGLLPADELREPRLISRNFVVARHSF